MFSIKIIWNNFLINKKLIVFFIVFAILFSFASKTIVSASVVDDFNYFQAYPLYEKYEKKQKYGEYKKLQKIKKKLGFDDSAKLKAAKDGYLKYKQYKKDPKKFANYVQYSQQYKDYSKYKKYTDANKYKKYKGYDKSAYDAYKGYGSAVYRAGYDRYVAFMNDLVNVTSGRGPEIRVGLWSYSKDDLIDTPFTISGNKQFRITDCATTIVGDIPLGENAKVTYVSGSNGILRVYNDHALISITDVGDKICFASTDGNNDDMIFDVNRPNSTMDHYRGKIKIQHSNTTDNEANEGASRRIWIINMLPLEHYVWGFGEIGGGIEEHSKAMLVAARTYARWYIEYATKWAEEGFHILSTSSSQIYYGYDYEKDHLTIPDLARKTNGIIMKYNSDIVLAAYSSWTDGKSRKYEDGLFGGVCKSATEGNTSILYPELSSVADPYGKNSTLDTCALATAGNHMVGMSANGSLVLARDHNWSWTSILSYYYSNVSIIKEY